MQIQKFRKQLESVSDSPLSDLKHLLAFVLAKPVASLLLHDVVLTSAQEQQLLGCIQRRLHGEPVAYIIGCWDFYGLELRLNPYTLIPRPETEELVELVLREKQLLQQQSLKLIDLGTGCGAIALAVAANKPGWQVYAAEKSEQALELAQQNAKDHKLDVHFYHADWYDWQPDVRFDVIVANPPYIASDDLAIATEVAQFEPASALFAAEQGLADIYAILRWGQQNLQAGGWLFLEHGHLQQQAVCAYAQACAYTQIRTVTDLSAKQRFLVAQTSR